MPKRADVVAANNVAKITKAIHLAAAKTLRKQNLPVQTIKLKSGSGAGAAMMEGKLSPPVQPSYYVAVIIPVYSSGKLSDPVQPS